MKYVNTVLGPLETNKMGVTLMHEHLLGSLGGISQSYPELLGNDFKERIIAGLMAAKHGGIDTIVDCTTMDLGRDIRILAEMSQRTGVNIIATTGWILTIPHVMGTFTADQFAQIFTRDIEKGIEGTDIKAGILKSQAASDVVTPIGAILLRGVARAHLATGIPIMLHSYSPGEVGRQQIAILKEEGVNLRRVKVDHSLDTTNLEYLTWLLDQGCYLGLDKLPGVYLIPRTGVSPESRIKTIKALIDAGFAKRLLLSHDAVLVSTFFDTLSDADKEKIARDNPYGFLYIDKVVMPRLRELGVHEEILESLLTDNPRRFFEDNPN